MLAVFLVLYGFQFLCLITPKLMLRGRLANSSAQSSQVDVMDMSGVGRRWLDGRVLPIAAAVSSPLSLWPITKAHARARLIGENLQQAPRATACKARAEMQGLQT